MCVFLFLFRFGFFCCLVGCIDMTVWTPVVLSVLCACLLYLLLFSAAEHGKAL